MFLLLFVVILVLTPSLLVAGPLAAVGAIGAMVGGTMGTVLTAVSAIASIGSMMGAFGGNDAPTMGAGYTPMSAPTPAPQTPTLPEVPAIAEKAPEIDQAAVDQVAVDEKKRQARRNITTQTDNTKGLLAQEQASTAKPTLLGG